MSCASALTPSREVLSERTKAAVAKRRAEGKPVGRPKGSSLDAKKETIVDLLAQGYSRASIAKILGYHSSTMRSFIISPGLDVPASSPDATV